MKVILLVDIKKLGKKFEVKEVPDGYARNFLIPKKLAQFASEIALKKLEARRAETEQEESDEKKHLELLARKISGTKLIFDVRTDDKGHSFGSVTKDMIQKALRDQKLVTKERVEVKVDHPLKTLGDHEIEIDLKKGIRSKLKITLRSQP